MNEINQSIYLKFKQEHIDNGGTAPEAYALTELILKSICEKNYKIYFGGGYDNTGVAIENFDVVFCTHLLVIYYFKFAWIIVKVIVAIYGVQLLMEN